LGRDAHDFGSALELTVEQFQRPGASVPTCISAASCNCSPTRRRRCPSVNIHVPEIFRPAAHLSASTNFSRSRMLAARASRGRPGSKSTRRAGRGRDSLTSGSRRCALPLGGPTDKRHRLGFTTGRLSQVQFQPNPGRHQGPAPAFVYNASGDSGCHVFSRQLVTLQTRAEDSVIFKGAARGNDATSSRVWWQPAYAYRSARLA